MSLLKLHSLVETVRLGVLTLEALDLDMVCGCAASPVEP